jgi:hypothetical protein
MKYKLQKLDSFLNRIEIMNGIITNIIGDEVYFYDKYDLDKEENYKYVIDKSNILSINLVSDVYDYEYTSNFSGPFENNIFKYVDINDDIKYYIAKQQASIEDLDTFLSYPLLPCAWDVSVNGGSLPDTYIVYHNGSIWQSNEDNNTDEPGASGVTSWDDITDTFDLENQVSPSGTEYKFSEYFLDVTNKQVITSDFCVKNNKSEDIPQEYIFSSGDYITINLDNPSTEDISYPYNISGDNDVYLISHFYFDYIGTLTDQIFPHFIVNVKDSPPINTEKLHTIELTKNEGIYEFSFNDSITFKYSGTGNITYDSVDRVLSEFTRETSYIPQENDQIVMFNGDYPLPNYSVGRITYQDLGDGTFGWVDTSIEIIDSDVFPIETIGGETKLIFQSNPDDPDLLYWLTTSYTPDATKPQYLTIDYYISDLEYINFPYISLLNKPCIIFDIKMLFKILGSTNTIQEFDTNEANNNILYSKGDIISYLDNIYFCISKLTDFDEYKHFVVYNSGDLVYDYNNLYICNTDGFESGGNYPESYAEFDLVDYYSTPDTIHTDVNLRWEPVSYKSTDLINIVNAIYDIYTDKKLKIESDIISKVISLG